MLNGISYNQLADLLWNAVQEKFGKDTWSQDIYDDYCVIRQEGRYYKVPFTLTEDGKSVTLGDRGEELSLDYVPISDRATGLKAAFDALPADADQAARDALAGEVRNLLAAGARNSKTDMAVMQQMMDLLKQLMGMEAKEPPEPGEQEMMAAEPMRLAAAADDGAGQESKGYTWQIRVANFGMDKQGRNNYPPEAMRAAKGLYEGAKVFALDESQHQSQGQQYGKSVKNIVGWIDGVKERDNGFDATFHILKSAKWLRDMVADAWEKGKKDLLGFSHDIQALTTKTMVGGKQVTNLAKVLSVEVDVVHQPVLGGQFLRMVAAKESGGKEQAVMTREQLLAALRRWRPDEHEKVEAKIAAKEEVSDEELTNLLAAAHADPTPSDDITGRLAAMETATCAATLRAALAESDLPEPTKEKLRASFSGKVFKEEELTAALVSEREYLGKIAGGGNLENLAAARMDVVGHTERLQAAIDKTFGVPVDEGKFKDVDAFDSLRAAYELITGDKGVTGYLPHDKRSSRMQAAMDTSSFSYILGNTMYRRLIADYLEQTYGTERLISTKRRAADYKQMESIRVSYFGDIPDIDPQQNDYTDLGNVTDEEPVRYGISNRGGIITITRQMILNDDLGAVQKIVGRLGRAFRRTHARRAWNKLSSNATYSVDGLAMFHANHNNLGSTALGTGTTAQKAAAVVAAITALANQTEPGSGENLGLDFSASDMNLSLVVPNGLWDSARSLNQAQYLDNNFTPNPVYHMFGENNDDIVVVPLLPDANDWYVLGNPADREILEAAYLNNNEEPQMFVADVPTIGQMFVGDKIQYKGRHEYEFAIADFRNAYKHVVA